MPAIGCGDRKSLWPVRSAVPNHGINRQIPHSDLTGIDTPFLEHVFRTNVFGVFWLCREAMPHLKRAKGTIIIVSSIAGLRPGGSSIAYAMTKAAVNHLTRSVLFATSRIIVSCAPFRLVCVTRRVVVRWLSPGCRPNPSGLRLEPMPLRRG